MKEATGELNNTVIVLLAVAAFAAFFFSTLWPMIRANYESETKCADAICGYTCDGTKVQPDESGGKTTGTITCCYRKNKQDSSEPGTEMKCPYKG